MNPKQPVKPFVDIAQNEKYPHIIDASLLLQPEIFQFDFFHCHLVIYPFARKISSENITINPFAEYTKDISDRRRSVYAPIINSAPQFFGLFLMFVLLTVVIILITYEKNIRYLEVLISLFGVYVIGKDFWDDIENFLSRLTKNWRLKYQDPYYTYELQKNTTLMRYSNLAKKERYGYTTILPERMDHIIASNSCTVRLLFEVEDFKGLDNDRAHLLSIRVDPTLLEEFTRWGYMIGVKLAFTRIHFGILETGYEMFQSIKNKETGSLNDKCEWLPETVVARKVWRIGKILHQSKGVVMENRRIMEFRLP